MQCKSINVDIKYGRYKIRAYEILKNLTKMSARSTSIIEDKNRQSLVEECSILNRWTEYCQELYNYPIKTDHSIIISQPRIVKIVIKFLAVLSIDELPILKS